MTKVKITAKKEEAVNTTENKESQEDNVIVLPGDELIESIDFLAGHGTYREGKKIFSKVVGILKKRDHVISVVPVAGKYMPKKGDYVIGEIDYVSVSNWKVDIGHPTNAMLPVSGVEEYIERDADLTKYFKRGDLILARVDAVTKNMNATISMKDKRARKLFGGRVIEITPMKVPRLIGKEGTMISQIKDKSGCIINVGQNGRVWIKGDNVDLAIKAIRMVEDNAHKKGLTDLIAKYLDDEIKSKE